MRFEAPKIWAGTKYYNCPNTIIAQNKLKKKKIRGKLADTFRIPDSIK